MVKIQIYDKHYPYLPTMGALLAFKQETGLEAHEVSPTDVEQNVRFAYYVVKFACLHHRDEPLAMSFEEFCAGLTVESYYAAIAASMVAAEEGGSEGKK